MVDSQDYKYYEYQKASNIAMCILGRFLFDDMGTSTSFFKEFVCNDKEDYTNTNGTILDKRNGYVYLSNLCPVLEEEIENPTEVEMTYVQFLQLLKDWEEKVIKLKPQEVVIKHENNQFILETTFSS
jgi:hypothetical protein